MLYVAAFARRWYSRDEPTVGGGEESRMPVRFLISSAERVLQNKVSAPEDAEGTGMGKRGSFQLY